MTFAAFCARAPQVHGPPSITGRIPDRVSSFRFRHLLEAHDPAAQILAAVNATLAAKGLMLKSGTVVDATLIAAPSSTRNRDGARDPEMHPSKKGNQWHFGMKAHIGVDAASGLVHTVRTTAGNEQIERLKAHVRAQVERPFRVTKRQFGHPKGRYKVSRSRNTEVRARRQRRFGHHPLPYEFYIFGEPSINPKQKASCQE